MKKLACFSGKLYGLRSAKQRKRKSMEDLIEKIIHQKIAHIICKIAKAFAVNQIVFEDLRRSQHSTRHEVGRWLSHNQQHFFHSQIIDRVRFMASFQS
ncbi:MAG: hypothetical protein ACTSYI_15290, partial [Promethearchaeota archaeon]